MNLGIGLGVIPILGVLLNLLRIQLYWPVFLVISLVIPVYSLYILFNKKGGVKIDHFRLHKSDIYILLALLIAVAFFYVYHQGSFTYPYLEDDDPWFHAVNAKYVSQMRSFTRHVDFDPNYSEPYPQGYVLLMGVLHQTNDEVIWNLKFFNALIISLGILFFFFFAMELFDDRKKALFATFGLAIIPCYLGHFVWASSLVLTLYFPALYALEKLRKEHTTSRSQKIWFIAASLIIASMLVTQPSNSFLFGILFFCYWLVSALARKKFLWRIILTGVLGLALALAIFWIPMLAKYGLVDTAAANTINLQGGLSSGLKSIQTIGSGGEAVYTLNDFLIAKKYGKIDNQIGLGIVMFFLGLFSFLIVIYHLIKTRNKAFFKENRWRLIVLIWGLIALISINGNKLPFPTLMPHRWWAILAIPLVLLCAEGFFSLGRISKRLKIPAILIYTIIILGLIWTSAIPKHAVQTSNWPPGVNWGSMDEVGGYISGMSSLPKGTKVFPLCSQEFKILAFDKIAEPWDQDYKDFKSEAFDMPAKKMNSWLKSRGYDYLTMDAYCLKYHDVNTTNDKFNELRGSQLFQLAASSNGFFLLKVI